MTWNKSREGVPHIVHPFQDKNLDDPAATTYTWCGKPTERKTKLVEQIFCLWVYVALFPDEGQKTSQYPHEMG